MYFMLFLVYSKTFQEHVQHLKLIFDIIRTEQLFLNRDKCQFATDRVEYLGHFITHYGVSTDPAKMLLMTLMTHLVTLPSHSKCTWVRDELRRRGKLVIGNDTTLKGHILTWLHDLAIGGHSGRDITAARVKSLFYWKGMNKDILMHIKNCLVCQTSKLDLSSSPGLLQPLPIRTRIWHDISLDFIEGLPNAKGKQVILVVVDHLSKYAHFIGLSQVFMDQISNSMVLLIVSLVTGIRYSLANFVQISSN